MKTKRLLLVLSCLFILTGMSQSQQALSQPSNFAQMRQSPMYQRSMEINMRNVFRTQWDGRGSNLGAAGLLQDADIRAAWGVSDEQFEYIQNIQRNTNRLVSEHPEQQELMREMDTLVRATGTHPFAPGADVDEETMDKILSIQGRMTALTMTVMMDAIDDALTPEQRQKVAESRLAMMGSMPIVSPGHFEVLGLTDAQREQMEAIKKELEPEFEKHLDDFVRVQMIVQNRFHDELERQGVFNNDLTDAERQERSQEISRTFSEKLREDEDFQRMNEEVHARGRDFSTRFRVRMFDVLDDEQWARLQYLIDNPPWLIGMRARMQREQAERNERNVWQPGPGSWQPGDPIPEAYRQQRNLDRRFPRPQQ